MREIAFMRDGKRIYGRLYVPEGSGPFATVILCHGFASNLSMMECYAESFAENGIAAYAFDFIGGGNDIRSDGAMTEMSVLTEARDLDAVIDGIRALGEVKDDELFLMGGSQGGFVCTYVASRRPEDVRGLILLFPAYVLQEDARRRTNGGKDIHEVSRVLGMNLGRIYHEDALSFDIYDVMGGYEGDVLIFHGTADDFVPISGSERALKIFKSAELVGVEGAGHGFGGEDNERVTGQAIDFVKKGWDRLIFQNEVTGRT